MPTANLLLASLLLVSTPLVPPFTGIYIDCSEISGNFATSANDAGGKLATSVNDAGGNFLDGQQMANSIILTAPQIEHLVKKMMGVNCVNQQCRNKL
jgi:hypothetical protein